MSEGAEKERIPRGVKGGGETIFFKKHSRQTLKHNNNKKIKNDIRSTQMSTTQFERIPNNSNICSVS